MKLSTRAFGLAAGTFWGFSVFLATWWIWAQGGGKTLRLLGNFYLGYSVTPLGSVIGLIYGFVDGFVSGWILAWLYNRFVSSQ